ncbi:hypothetical protein B0T22DRAFT_457693 [Podospora appendiculata]|uniref:Uncharacterized protein n=1 Tax=Podospora appendiculata TaxID=314037 RepID=A0AAE0X889_9PEZI|nr:hypothetical protein B0T22DRAFT_457693 [Podospora appendiculata]
MLSRRLQLSQSFTRQWQRQQRQRQRQRGGELAAAWASFATSCPRESSSPSLYEQLFPKKSPPDTQPKSKPDPRRKRIQAPESRPASSENDLDNASPVAQDDKTKHSDVSKLFAKESGLGQWRQALGTTKPERGQQKHSLNPPPPPQAVLVLNSAPKSLMESDFYRIAHQGLHVDGWVRGLVKVAQARSPATQEPRGQYFLFFDSRDAALSYSDKLERLHKLSRVALPAAWKSDCITGASLDGNTNAAGGVDTPTDAPGLKTYTLLPPNANLCSSIWSADDIRPHMFEKQSPKLPAADPKSPGPKNRAQSTPPDARLLEHLLHHQGGISSDPDTARHNVLIRLYGSKITTGALRHAIDADGRERNLPWKLGHHDSAGIRSESADKAIRGLEASRSEIKWGMIQNMNPDAPGEDDGVFHYNGEGQGKGKAHSGFGRFVVSFSEPGEARRFVRAWHMRELLDWRTERMMTLHVTGLW